MDRRPWLMQAGLLAGFVAAIAATALVLNVATPAIISVLAEGPFESSAVPPITLDNRSGFPVLITVRQVGETEDETHRLRPDQAVQPEWTGCSTADVAVQARGSSDARPTERRLRICAGDVVFVDRLLQVRVE